MLNSSIRFTQTFRANGQSYNPTLTILIWCRSCKAKQIKVADLFTILWSSDSQALTVMENMFTDVHSLTTVLHSVKETPFTMMNCIHHWPGYTYVLVNDGYNSLTQAFIVTNYPAATTVKTSTPAPPDKQQQNRNPTFTCY